jgi:hypothetical protein
MKTKIVICEIMCVFICVYPALVVLSDHGFTSFERGVNLNAWVADYSLALLFGRHAT